MIALIYNPNDPKLKDYSYSQTYRYQFLALKEVCDIEVTESCNAQDIEADVIIFYDVHSSHHIELDGIAAHPAVKYEYFNDPKQLHGEGVYSTGEYAVKLGAEERTRRALARNVDYIICPYTNMYYQYIAPYLQNFAEKMLVWFPPAPGVGLFHDRERRLKDRQRVVMGCGAVKESHDNGYITREWAHQQPYITHIPHILDDKETPWGEKFPDFLSNYAAAIAITDDHIVPKHLEIPLAGCVCFATGHEDYKRMGFKDGENCYFVDKTNLKDKAEHFLSHVEEHQEMADKGRKLIEENWTNKHFGEFIKNHANSHTST